MVHILYQKMQLAFAQKANRLIFTVREIKLLGGLISEEWYVRSDVKRVLGVLGMVFGFLGDILKKICYFSLVIVFPNIVLRTVMDFDRTTLGGMILWSFFFMNCMLGSFVNSHITTDGDENDYLLLNLMRFNPKEHYLTGIIWEYGKQCIYYGVMLLVVMAGILDGRLQPVLWLLGVYVCFRFIGEAVRLKLNDRFGIPFQNTDKTVTGFYYFYNFCMFLLAYGVYPLLFFLGGRKSGITIPFLENSWFLGLFFILAVLAMVVSVRYLWNYPDYVLIARRMCNMQMISEAKVAVETVKKSAYTLQDKEVDEEELQSRMYQEKSGYDYLNAIFFQRHKRLVRDAVLIKTNVAGIIFGIVAIALIVAQMVMTEREFIELSDSTWKTVNNFMPVMVFLMYCASSGKDLTRAMFYNCDISLLKFGYYRSPEAILQGFQIRLKYMIRAEFPTVLVFAVGVIGNTLLLHQQKHWLQMLFIVLCACILTVFYSIVFLCMYYIFQPFTEGGSQTGTGYAVCSGGLYLLAYTCLQLHTASAFFTVLVLGVTIVMLIAGFAIAWRLAPKTFRLK